MRPVAGAGADVLHVAVTIVCPQSGPAVLGLPVRGGRRASVASLASACEEKSL